MKKILFYFSQNDLGGHTRFVIDLSRELESRGFESTVYVPFFTHFYYQMKVLKNGTAPIAIIRFFLGQISRMVRYKFQWRGKKMLPPKNLKVKRYVLKPKRSFLKSHDLIVTSAAWHVNELESCGFFERKKILHVMHHPHTYDQTKVESYFLDQSVNVLVSCKETHDAMKLLGVRSTLVHLGVRRDREIRSIQKNESVTLFFYKHPRKNPTLIIEVVNELLQTTQFNLMILGNGFPKPKNPNRSRLRVIENASDSEYFRLLAETKIFVYISKNEGFGLPPLEAMSLGTATISSPVGAVPEYGENYSNVLMLSSEPTVDEVVQAIHSLHSNSSLRQLIEVRGMETASKFSINNCADEYAKVITMMLKVGQ